MSDLEHFERLGLAFGRGAMAWRLAAVLGASALIGAVLFLWLMPAVAPAQ